MGGDDVITIDELRHKDDWVLDVERNICNVCTRSFTYFRRKHHCRTCGDIVCRGCALKMEAELPDAGRSMVKVCVSCILTRSEPSEVARRAAQRMARDENRENRIIR